MKWNSYRETNRDWSWLPEGTLTQFGRDDDRLEIFRIRPRLPGEADVSMILGVVDVDTITRLVTGRPAQGDERVRYFEAAELVAAGYEVWMSPSKRNRFHVSVTCPLRDADEDTLEMWWTNGDRPNLDDLARDTPKGKES